MARAGSAYVVRDAGAGTASGNVDKVYPYTLRGLTDALEEARFRSFAGPPQVVLVKVVSGLKPIRLRTAGKPRPGTPPVDPPRCPRHRSPSGTPPIMPNAWCLRWRPDA